MSAVAQPIGIDPAAKNRAIAAALSTVALFLGAFLSGFVINEPAPYELYMAALIPVWALFGLTIPRATAPLVILLLVFNLGGVISLLVLPNIMSQLMYVLVSFFLAFTSIFFAAVIAGDYRRLNVLMSGYLAAALITATAGILGYLGVIPGGEIFTRFGRARGVFEDPNVFAPFLMLPTLYCIYLLMTRPLSGLLPRLIMTLVLVMGVFLSFSRAGWGMLVICTTLLAVLTLTASSSNKLKLRVLVMVIASVATALLALMVALQFDVVRDVFTERAQLVQSYDGAREGRFARHWIGLLMALEHPFGIGPLQFGKIFGEDTHNIWLKALFDYSWLGFIAYAALVFWTLGIGLRIMFRDRPWQGVLICAWVVFFGHTVIGYVIDTDHWRHFFLILGIIWGCVALEARWQRGDIVTLNRA
ncbi:MAG: O-antigen ligase family protein [Pseudomonadota bacterium]